MFCGDHFTKYINTESFFCTPETTITCQLHLNKNLIKPILIHKESSMRKKKKIERVCVVLGARSKSLDWCEITEIFQVEK